VADVVAFLARRRVALGGLTAIAAIVLARPTWSSWYAGLAVAIVGEAVRVWAAGHLEKSREVTTSGPYRWTRHPLYVGSSVLALGVVIAARSYWLAGIAAIYLAVTFTAAIRREEAFLRQTFGDAYDRYTRAENQGARRHFSLERAVRNKEYRAVLGLLAGFGLLALRVRFLL
jgi:protein-S-isoprenylcysteine O-methyltransferase Ste14